LRLILLPLTAALSVTLAIGAWAATPQTATTFTKKKKPAAKSAPKTSTTTAAKRTTSSKSKRPAVVAHRAPQQPSVERYKEIQQALADKGYFKSEPDGTWGSASIDALKRFQHDQKLAEDGKIGSLSLIALGLGPKREPVAAPE
jgi:peptidoglycan hydrolase-like protein with peptidoglycan-binding domain